MMKRKTPSKSLINEKGTVGIDVGIKDFAVLSSGEKKSKIQNTLEILCNA
ncbi:MAG: hypothetical protein JXA38_00825 [Methanosarcinaceae archaeon]|nr:hypothetical protein [Methanosarcinaceae archaeon]